VTFKDLRKIIDDQRKSLDRLGLWPQGDDGNGHDHGKDNDKLARQLYEDHRVHWYFHDSSWYMRGVNGYDGQGCNQYTGCVPECIYSDGRIDLSELERIKNEIDHTSPKWESSTTTTTDKTSLE
jgi:hypothetical protein